MEIAPGRTFTLMNPTALKQRAPTRTFETTPNVPGRTRRELNGSLAARRPSASSANVAEARTTNIAGISVGSSAVIA